MGTTTDPFKSLADADAQYKLAGDLPYKQAGQSVLDAFQADQDQRYRLALPAWERLALSSPKPART
jgi:hypothetical protein